MQNDGIYSVKPKYLAVNDRLSYDGSTGAAAPCLPLWGRCPSAHTGADEVGTHRRFVPVPSKRKSCCPALFFPSMVLYAHTGLGAFQPHPTRLTPGHLPQRGRLWCGKRSFTSETAAGWNCLRFGNVPSTYTDWFSGTAVASDCRFPEKERKTSQNVDESPKKW